MDIGKVFIIIGWDIICLLVASLYWFKFRPNYKSYKDSIMHRPFLAFWGIDNEKKWRLAWSIATAIAITIAVVVPVIAMLGVFGR